MGVVARGCICLGVGGALVLSLLLAGAPASAQSALLDALSTRVTLVHPGGSSGNVATEQIIRSGDTVATDETGRAVVTYPDGSTALLEESSALTIEFVQTGAGDYIVRMQQTLGRVWYAVARAVTLGGRYEVRTPGMASVVRAGSGSYVSVSPTGETTIVATSGTVDTSAGGVDVSVPAGSSTTVSGPVAAPDPRTPTPATAAPVSQPATPAPSSPSSSPSPVSTPAPLPLLSSAPTTKTTGPTLPIPTPKPIAAPTPVATPDKDKFGPRKDAPGQPPPKPKLAL